MNLEKETSNFVDAIVDIRKDIDELREHYQKKIILIEKLRSDVFDLRREIEDIKKRMDELNTRIDFINFKG